MAKSHVKNYRSDNRRRIFMSLVGGICIDLICVITGCILFVAAGNPISSIPTIAGIGTIITAFFMGPLIEFFNEKFARPFLNKKNVLIEKYVKMAIVV